MLIFPAKNRYKSAALNSKRTARREKTNACRNTENATAALFAV